MARRTKVDLPSVLTKDTWFYKVHPEMCEPHLGKPYISYSTVDSWENYREDLFKQKFVGLKLDAGVYAEFGSYLGEAVENGKFGENPQGFQGQENFQGFIEDLPENAEFEKMIIIDMGSYVIVGFIDIYNEDEHGRANVIDLKTGGKKKEEKYESDDYIQVPLYAKAIEDTGKEIGTTGVWFVRREGSHFNPPLKISKDQFFIKLEYNEERAKYALDKVDRVVREISDYYKTFKKIFGDVKAEI